ncbi:hypothetical protein D3C86_1407290 [compost metagenome]
MQAGFDLLRRGRFGSAEATTADSEQVNAQGAADDAADGTNVSRTGDLLELGQEVGYVAFAQVSAQQALLSAGAFQNIVAGQAGAQGFQALGRRGHFRFACGFRQLYHDLLHLNQASGRTRTLVAHVYDINAAIDGDGI